jgi:hypothetical protein
MKTLLSVLMAATAILGAATSVTAYSFSPSDTSVRLRGTLTFYPGGQSPFSCKVVFRLRTKGSGGVIRSIDVNTPSCNGIAFGSLPWNTGPSTATSGVIENVNFSGPGSEQCHNTFETFQDDASGIWTIADDGHCISGTLRSTPPVTIVP